MSCSKQVRRAAISRPFSRCHTRTFHAVILSEEVAREADDRRVEGPLHWQDSGDSSDIAVLRLRIRQFGERSLDRMTEHEQSLPYNTFQRRARSRVQLLRHEI